MPTLLVYFASPRAGAGTSVGGGPIVCDIAGGSASYLSFLTPWGGEGHFLEEKISQSLRERVGHFMANVEKHTIFFLLA